MLNHTTKRRPALHNAWANKYSTKLEGTINLSLSRRNAITSITKIDKNVIGWSSAGMFEENGRRRHSPDVAVQLASRIASAAKDHKLQYVTYKPYDVRFYMYSSFVSSVRSANLKFVSVESHVRKPYNGCRKRKARRL